MNAVDDPRITPGCRVLVYDYTLFKNDIDTPARSLMLPATIICRYGYKNNFDRIYPDLVDVQFDHRPQKISNGHFTSGIEVIHD